MTCHQLTGRHLARWSACPCAEEHFWRLRQPACHREHRCVPASAKRPSRGRSRRSTAMPNLYREAACRRPLPAIARGSVRASAGWDRTEPPGPTPVGRLPAHTGTWPQSRKPEATESRRGRLLVRAASYRLLYVAHQLTPSFFQRPATGEEEYSKKHYAKRSLELSHHAEEKKPQHANAKADDPVIDERTASLLYTPPGEK